MTSSSSEPVRVGLIGYGLSGKCFHAPLLTTCPGLVLTHVASSRAGDVETNLPGAEAVANPLDLIAAEAVDLVVVASPNATHASLARAALLAGKDVVVDKPFTLDLAQARELASLAAAQGRVLSVFQNRRWDSDYLGVAGAIRDGSLGRVTHFESRMDRYRPEVRDRWRERSGPGSGLWFDLGPHLVDQALQLFGIPARILASFARQRDGAEVEDWAQVVLDYGPLRAVLEVNSLVSGGTNRFTVHGDKASLAKREADPQDAQIRAGLRPGALGWGVDRDSMTIWRHGAPAELRPVPAGDHRRFYMAVRDAILGMGRNPVPPSEAIAVMSVLDAAAEAARSHAAAVPDLTSAEAELHSGST